MAISDIYQLTIVGQLHGQTILNVLHYQQSGGSALNTSQELVTEWRAFCEAHWLACCSNEYKIVGYICQRIRPLPVMAAYESGALNLSGTVAQNSLPTSMAAVLTKRTDIAGRSYRGRIYMAGVPATYEDDSEITGAASNVYGAVATDLVGPMTDPANNTWAHVLWRRKVGQSQPITSVVVRATLRNQRRRQVGRGQ